MVLFMHFPSLHVHLPDFYEIFLLIVLYNIYTCTCTCIMVVCKEPFVTLSQSFGTHTFVNTWSSYRLVVHKPLIALFSNISTLQRLLCLQSYQLHVCGGLLIRCLDNPKPWYYGLMWFKKLHSLLTSCFPSQYHCEGLWPNHKLFLSNYMVVPYQGCTMHVLSV